MSEMTICERILARASGRECVKPGEVIEAEPDIAMSHDNTHLVYNSFKEIGASEIKNPSSIIVVLDHRSPASTVNSANIHASIRKIIPDLGIDRFFDVGTGICHQILVEKGIVEPGMLVLGTDSHSTTYGAVGALGIGIGATDMAAVWVKGSLWLKVPSTILVDIQGNTRIGVFAKDIALKLISELGVMGADYSCLEFRGGFMEKASLSERMTLCNMAAETGAKCAIVPENLGTDEADGRAGYSRSISIDARTIDPLIALPHSVDSVASVGSVEGTRINQAFLGSCTNGRIDDLRIAASILADKKIDCSTRLIVTPASSEVYLAALREGIIEKFIEAGATVTNPGCGPCLGAHQGVLANEEVCISSSNRNFKGRMGSADAEIYLASPATVMASAIEGAIADPRRYIE